MEKAQVKVTEWSRLKVSGRGWASDSVFLTVQVLGQLGRYHTRTVELPLDMLREILASYNVTPIEIWPEPLPSPEEKGSPDSVDSQDPR